MEDMSPAPWKTKIVSLAKSLSYSLATSLLFNNFTLSKPDLIKELCMFELLMPSIGFSPAE